MCRKVHEAVGGCRCVCKLSLLAGDPILGLLSKRAVNSFIGSSFVVLGGLLFAVAADGPTTVCFRTGLGSCLRNSSIGRSLMILITWRRHLGVLKASQTAPKKLDAVWFLVSLLSLAFPGMASSSSSSFADISPSPRRCLWSSGEKPPLFFRSPCYTRLLGTCRLHANSSMPIKIRDGKSATCCRLCDPLCSVLS